MFEKVSRSLKYDSNIFSDSHRQSILYPFNYLSRECGLYKASDLLLGDHVCENLTL